jgi:hypothetical protein
VQAVLEEAVPVLLTTAQVLQEQPILVVVEVAVLAGLVPDKLVMEAQAVQALLSLNHSTLSLQLRVLLL